MLNLKYTLGTEIEQVVRFISETLGSVPQLVEIDSEEGEPVVQNVDYDLEQVDFQEIVPSEFHGRAASVDGGSVTVLSGRSFALIAYRTAFNIFHRGIRIEEYTAPIQLAVISQKNKNQVYGQQFQRLFGQAPAAFPDLEGVLDRLRSLEEWRLAEVLVDKLDRNDLLLMDGSLTVSEAIPKEFLTRLIQKTASKNITLVGLSKSSTLFWKDNAELVPTLVKRAQDRGSVKPWYAKVIDAEGFGEESKWLGDIYVGKLKASSEFAFRVDIDKDCQTSVPAVFATLSYLSSDPVFLGYPYPLAAAHLQACIPFAEVEDMRLGLQQGALRAGITESDWNLLFGDFHQTLNRGLSS